MQTFVMVTRVSPDALRAPKSLEDSEKRAMEKVRKECKVEWIQNLATLGPYDYVDVFQAPDTNEAFKVAALIRSFGHANTEIWPATEWQHFKEMVRDMPTST
jgi:uncharacterized protein with GYD domain